MEENKISIQSKVFKFKLDFYYQQSLLYLITLIFYAGIRGTFDFERLPTLGADPLLYLIILFVLISFLVLILNKMRDRKLIITSDKIIFHNKYREYEIGLPDIEWIHIGRERKVQTAGVSQAIVFKWKSRKRLFRIRIGRYEREKELMNEMQRIAQRVPKGRKPILGVR
ncbi:MAG: hypothetical protein QME52_07080 [Bacteroidota bacterium]|nr:hypothetical protein [Bacteroidota bacterium]